MTRRAVWPNICAVLNQKEAELENKLLEVRNCLFHLRTPDEAARRRLSDEQDEDAYIFPFGSPYRVDACQKILPSKGIRRSSNKTQVMTTGANAHIRTRLVHTLEVVHCATLVARILGLNEDLCLAQALGHDLGHTPFGHVGEGFISQVTGKKFRHEVFSVVVAQHVERGGRGLNLTHQTLRGMLSHSRGDKDLKPSDNVSEEANVVMNADKIGYVWADINDIFFRTKLRNLEDYRELRAMVEFCGDCQRERVMFCIRGLCLESAEKGRVSFLDSPEAEMFAKIKKAMYAEGIYEATNIPESAGILQRVYGYLCQAEALREKNIEPAVALALMTDSDVLNLIARLDSQKTYAFLTPETQKEIIGFHLQKCSFSDILNGRKCKNPIDFTNPDLDW